MLGEGGTSDFKPILFLSVVIPELCFQLAFLKRDVCSLVQARTLSKMRRSHDVWGSFNFPFPPTYLVYVFQYVKEEARRSLYRAVMIEGD
jgi:hypothetical protein